jgi:predicted metal-dependent HD superfamily phosphohydrolase
MDPFRTFKNILKNHISDKAIYELPMLWNKKDRFYHNTTHLIQILKDIESNYSFNFLNIYEKRALLLAAFFHDSIYDPRRSDNEDQSIKYFISSYKGKDVKMLDVVCKLIETTKHRKRPLNKLKRIFWDADNAKFKDGYDSLLNYEKLIQKEYSFLSRKEYKEKRIKILENSMGLFGDSVDKNIKKLIEYINKNM